MNSLDIYKMTRNYVTQTAYYGQPLDTSNYYMLIITTMFHELMTNHESPLISTFCSEYRISVDSKNFTVQTGNSPFMQSGISAYDMAVILLGINAAFSEGLDACMNFYQQNAKNLFVGATLETRDFYNLKNWLKALDEKIGKFSETIAKPVIQTETVTVTETVIVPAAYDAELTAELNQLAKERTASDETIIDDIKNLQRALQGSLKEISDLRDDIDFRTVKAPIEHLLVLIDKLNDTLKQHPNETEGKGYKELIKRCNNFSRYLLQALAGLGAEIINTADVPINPDEHETFERASLQAKVVKVTRIGCKYKGKIIRKAQVEVEEPVAQGGNAQ